MRGYQISGALQDKGQIADELLSAAPCWNVACWAMKIEDMPPGEEASEEEDYFSPL